MSGAANLLGANVVNKSGEKVDIATSCEGKVVGIYFSAHWCPPCRGFTPVLAEFYNTHHEAKNFEIVFVSSDRDTESFNGYFGEMPWLALSFDDRTKKEELASKFQVRGIPSFILIDGDSGETINEDGRGYVTSDAGAVNFPWKA